MPEYALPRVYIGSDSDAADLIEEIQQIAALNPARFSSTNKFLAHCVVYTLKHDKHLRRPPKKSV